MVPHDGYPEVERISLYSSAPIFWNCLVELILIIPARTETALKGRCQSISVVLVNVHEHDLDITGDYSTLSSMVTYRVLQKNTLVYFSYYSAKNINAMKLKFSATAVISF